MGRGHEWERVEQATQDARKAGFHNLNLDLMFGLAGQTLGMFQESVTKAVWLKPEHLSLYALQVEEGTPLAKQVAEGLKLPSEDEVADEYAWAQAALAKRGLNNMRFPIFPSRGRPPPPQLEHLARGGLLGFRPRGGGNRGRRKA